MTDAPMPTTASATIDIDAPPSAVYALVADITRMGEWSPECARCEWTGDTTFHGYNAVGDFEWDIECEVVERTPDAVFAFHGPVGADDGTTWRYVFEAVDGGTRVTESFDAPTLGDPTTTSGSIPGRDQMLVEGMQQTLHNIKDAAEA
jgi:uncharacterized protein YndB with AHSA1/START domain